MSRIGYIFMIGMGGVFLSMALLYGAIRLNALVSDFIAAQKSASPQQNNPADSGNAEKQ